MRIKDNQVSLHYSGNRTGVGLQLFLYVIMLIFSLSTAFGDYPVSSL